MPLDGGGGRRGGPLGGARNGGGAPPSVAAQGMPFPRRVGRERAPGRAWRVLLAMVLVLALSWPPLARPAAAAAPSPDRLGRLQEQLESMRVQSEFLALKVKDTRAHVRKLETQIAKKQERVASLQGETAALASESALLDQQIIDLGLAIKEGQAKIAGIRARFRGRLVHLHKIRQGTLITSILAARDLNSFLNRFQMVRHLLQGDRQLLEAMKAQAERLAADARSLADKQKRQTELVALNQKSQEDLTAEMSGLSAMLETLLLERKLFLARQERLKQSQAALEQEIDRLESVRTRQPAEVEPAAGAATPDEPPHTGQAMAVAASGSVAANPGRLAFRWPVQKVQLLGFQETASGTPPGLEILVNGETEVQAAALGKVLFKGPLGQFGNLIILGHKKGFSTVYGNLDDMWVGLGQIVQAGETIGRVLGVKRSRLHFEIRFGGRNEDPLPFLPRLP